MAKPSFHVSHRWGVRACVKPLVGADHRRTRRSKKAHAGSAEGYHTRGRDPHGLKTAPAAVSELAQEREVRGGSPSGASISLDGVAGRVG